MVKVNGNNVFKDNVFDWQSWSADILQTPAEVDVTLKELNLIGKRIVDIRTVGGAFDLEDWSLESFINSYAKKLSNEERNGVDAYDWYSPSIPYPRQIEIDEPVIIIFEDGERLEIDFSEGSSIRISKNCLPTNIKPGVLQRNFNAKEFFSPCIGEVLLGFEVDTTTDIQELIGWYGTALDENQPGFVNSLWLLLSGGKKLLFEPYFDYGFVAATDMDCKALSIPMGEMEKIVDEMANLCNARHRET